METFATRRPQSATKAPECDVTSWLQETQQNRAAMKCLMAISCGSVFLFRSPRESPAGPRSSGWTPLMRGVRTTNRVRTLEAPRGREGGRGGGGEGEWRERGVGARTVELVYEIPLEST